LTHPGAQSSSGGGSLSSASDSASSLLLKGTGPGTKGKYLTP
jgi:hypothetical protein